MNKLFKKIISIIILTILISHCSEVVGLKKLYGQNNLQLNSSQLKRFKDYVRGEYYSFELERYVSHQPIMFAISNDGSTSLIFACASRHMQCNNGVEMYQFIKRYSKKSGKDLKIFAIKDKIVWGENNKIIKSKNFDAKNLMLKDIVFIDSKESNFVKNSFYDISILPHEGKDDDFE